MKALPILLCCLIFVFEYKLVNGQNFVKDFIGKLHNTREKVKADVHTFAEKIKSDVQKIVHPKRKNDLDKDNNVTTTNEDVVIFVTSSTSTPKTTPSNADSVMVFPTEEPEVPVVTPARPVLPTTPTTVPPVVKTTTQVGTVLPDISSSTPVTAKSGNATDNEGKENFAGGCLPGFLRTSDGRCMPTY